MDTALNNKVMATWKTYAGVFLVTAATLLLELLLTRIWSVTMWYHFAFVAVSLAMFGMTGGALLIYLMPNRFPQNKTESQLSLATLCFGISIIISFLCHLAMPFMPDKSLSGLFAMGLSYLTISIPFIFSGIVITLALTRYSQQVNKMYAADLSGAAIGCLLFIGILDLVDGPTAVIVSSLVALCAALLLSTNKKQTMATIIAVVSVGLLVVLNVWSVQIKHPLVRLMWVKANFQTPSYFERWNSLSRVSVDGDPEHRFASPDIATSNPSEKEKGKQLLLTVDSLYSTPLPGFSGKLADADYLKHDISFLAHYLRQDANVLVIGVGGGRDILAALNFNQKSITAVEINKIFTDLLLNTFADFSSNFARDKKVTLVNDEARSFASRQKDKFDIIQLSFISTGTASSTGAFALTENSLYTKEAWQMLLNHLTDDGILTCTRNYFVDEKGLARPGELQRLISLARAALEQNNIASPEAHIVCISHTPSKAIDEGIASVTMLVGKKAFSEKDLIILAQVAKDNNFNILLTPKYSSEPSLKTLASGNGLAELTNEFPTRIDAPTDDNPFFFYILRLEKLFTTKASEVGTYAIYTKAMEILIELLIVVVVLTAACFVVPLALTNKSLKLKRDLPLLTFFASVGLGFMFIEVSQLQRLVIFLGHPTYSLSVVLFSLLLSSGLGSYLAGIIKQDTTYKGDLTRLTLLLFALGAYAYVSPVVVHSLQAATTPERVIATIAMLFPLGLLMGMAVPAGLRLAQQESAEILPWLWGVNGATSVCASVVAVAVAINWGLTNSYWIGVICYLAACTAFACARKSLPESKS
ncbi:MAG: hypothetical protein K2Y22_13795 [Candidatus Obscuribacterales bacterium]|nr:hypothetical protein [Candidatus Obscuribacterales bacterium]